MCESCNGTDVQYCQYSERDARTFKCNNCRFYWTVNKIAGIDYGQVCQNCNSNHVVRYSGIQHGKQRFRCQNCKKSWSIPVTDLVVKKSDNDLRYEECLI